MRHQDAETIGADEAHARSACVLRREIGERTGPVTEPRGHDNGGSSAFLRRRGDDVRNASGGHRDHRNVGRLRQSLVRFDGANTLDLVIVRIDDVNRTRETRTDQVFHHGATG